ncbi:hypothetical protein EST54_19585 [Streptomyces sioyaensis]|uniref:Uncharacterized protein n=1 Tax=Streptomyces sioyaensis TaxID=67364 RepID=A0A4Q1QYW1_9ACTN|nr:hypothetical protein EST54_19585 [Streptomyces sioyaensis]
MGASSTVPRRARRPLQPSCHQRQPSGDLTLDDLHRFFDAVICATGTDHDRHLDFPSRETPTTRRPSRCSPAPRTLTFGSSSPMPSAGPACARTAPHRSLTTA